jgi:hypothetical protein
MASSSADADSAAQLSNTVRAMTEKRPIPEIDFTLHKMEDGTQVSTMERICKGRSEETSSLGLQLIVISRCPSTCLSSPN